jgi:hypothetical protein
MVRGIIRETGSHFDRATEAGNPMGNIEITPEEKARAKLMAIEAKAQRKMRKNAAKSRKKRGHDGPPRGSVYAVSGGLPTLGKRR